MPLVPDAERLIVPREDAGTLTEQQPGNDFGMQTEGQTMEELEAQGEQMRNTEAQVTSLLDKVAALEDQVEVKQKLIDRLGTPMQIKEQLKEEKQAVYTKYAEPLNEGEGESESEALMLSLTNNAADKSQKRSEASSPKFVNLTQETFCGGDEPLPSKEVDV